MVWLWLWPRRLIVVHDAFASRGVAEEQIAFFDVAQARVGVLSAEVSTVAWRLARARHASVDALTDVMVAVVVLAVVAADLCAEVRAVGRWLVAACRYRVVDAVVLALHLGPHGLDKIMRTIGSAAIGIMHHVIGFFTVRGLVRAVFNAWWHVISRAVATVGIAVKLIAEYTTKVVTHALAEVFILATARRVNAASTIESSVGIGEACHHVAYCCIMIAIIGKAEVAAESIRILLRATCQVDFALAALKVACHHLACLVHAVMRAVDGVCMIVA